MFCVALLLLLFDRCCGILVADPDMGDGPLADRGNNEYYEHIEQDGGMVIHDNEHIPLTSSEIMYFVLNPEESPLQFFNGTDWDLSGHVWQNVSKNHEMLINSYHATISMRTDYTHGLSFSCSAFFTDATNLLTAKRCVENCLCQPVKLIHFCSVFFFFFNFATLFEFLLFCFCAFELLVQTSITHVVIQNVVHMRKLII